MLGCITTESQLDNVPVVIAVRTTEGAGAIRDVQAMMDLHRLRDRDYVFKEVNLDQRRDIVECFTWIARKKREH